MNSLKVAVVVPNWNGKHLLTACIESLLSQAQKTEIIVVDNGSSDGSVALVENNYPSVNLIKLEKNHGFAGGVNAGIRHALELGCEYVALLNNDAVAEEKWLEILVSTIDKNQKIGIVTGKILRDDKKHIDSTGDFYSVWGMPFPRGRNQIDTGQYDKETSVFAASGGASLYRSKMLKDIGLFDEAFFAYFEDVDISFRARLAGWDILYEPSAKVYHKVNATSSKLGSFSRYHTIKNFYMLYAKNMPGWLYFKYLPLFILQAARLGASSIIKGGGMAYFRGMARAFLNTPHITRERHKIQKNRRLTPRQVDALLYKSRPPRIPKI